MSRWLARCVAAALGLALAMPQHAAAGPNDGEPRPIHRDTDRVYTTVAGEPDGAATVTNPANLGFLRGVNGIVDLAWTRQNAFRRGSGVGAFIGIPLPWQILALGFGYQFLYPFTPVTNGTETESPQGADDPYSKVTFALAVPLVRWLKPKWAKNLSFGVNYSRLISSRNFHAVRTNQVDIGVAWWPLRFMAIGLMARGINVPHTGPDRSISQSYVLEPELAFRPLGTKALELAIGVRVAPIRQADARWRTHVADPRGRLLINLRGVRVFAEAERFQFFNPDPDEGTEPRDAVRITAGFGLDFGHFGFLGGATTSAGGASSFAADGAVARLRFSQERYDSVVNVRPRIVTKLQLSKYAGDRGMWSLIEQIDDIAARRGVALVETTGLSLGYGQLEEVREALLRVRARGGRVAVYMQGGSLRSYFLATSADRIIAHPNAGLEVLGMRIQRFYFADLLAKLGVKAEFVRVAEYKGVPDQWERSGPSEPVERQHKQLVSDLWNHVLRTVARERGQDPLVVKDWIDAGPTSSAGALRDGMVDELAFPDELDLRMEMWIGRKVRIEPPSKQKEHVELYGLPPRIAVLSIEGDLVDGESFTIPLIGRKVAGSTTLTKQIERLRNDEGVRAVVVRIDSPGGSVRASDEIARELDLTRKRKPVVISMGNVCASGGYYVATAGQYIFADATTATGSIGIFYPKFDLSGLADKLGIGIDRFDFGDHAGLRSLWKPYTDDERAAAQRDIEDGYREFTARVGRARNMNRTQVDEVARGRVWSGVRAIEVGLVDDYGGLREAIIRARAIAGLRADEGQVVIVPDPKGPLANLRSLLGFKLPNPLAAEGLPSPIGGGVATLGLGAALPLPLLRVLALLPISLWYGDRPGALALADETIVIED
ncbi:MAG: signal peptide peptidase SppA [Deltaproteobacteria bacterium]|nr:signal peptide peptidase SppA [Nannocystaceae bacterium]